MSPERASWASDGSRFKEEQRAVAISMAVALGISLLALGMAARSVYGAAPAPFTDRLEATLRADCLVFLVFGATIANVARLRFFSEQDIAGSGTLGGSERIGRAGAVAQNTLEQAVLAAAAHMVVTATFTRSRELVLTLVALFVVGRLLFWAGYKRGAKGRALGFALTFYPSVLALLASLAISSSGSMLAG